jgi:hypothetical protein
MFYTQVQKQCTMRVRLVFYGPVYWRVKNTAFTLSQANKLYRYYQFIMTVLPVYYTNFPSFLYRLHIF